MGTRPEAIKMAPIIKEIERHPGSFNTVTCVTAQHRDMLDQVLNLFHITPQYDLNIMKADQDLFDVTIEIMKNFKQILYKEKPDILIVQGDTTTTFITSLAAFYQKVPIGHVEAGLRTHNKYSPFPEEMNRHLTTVLTDLHFCPTEGSKSNLIREGESEDKIFVTGNTVIDALFMTVKDDNDGHSFTLPECNIDFDKRLILVTAHRRESFGEPFKNICHALREIADNNRDVEIIYPVHLNPNVQEPVYEILGNHSRIKLIEPLDYEPFVKLMNKAYMILTDSGGIQEEAPSLGKPVLVLREITERPEAVAAGTVKLVNTNKETIVAETQHLLGNKEAYDKMSRAINPYGDGKASERIVNILTNYLNA